MQAIAHSPSFAKKAGVSQSVGKDFSAADKSKTFKKGDMMKKRYDTGGGVDFDADDDPESQKVFRDDDAGGLTELSDEERMPRRSASAPRKASKGGSIMESKKMMGGGMAYAKGGGIESRGKTKGTVIRMAAGGSVSARADGIAQRGKTKFKNY
jgi:hypothetical protein